MTSTASPHQTPLSSTRTSLDTTSISIPSPRPAPQARRNRAALRDYYGLKNVPADSSRQSSLNNVLTAGKEAGTPQEDVEVKHSELDEEGFDPEAYVKGVLARENLEGVLKVEAQLVGEIKALDGERKALVYDNYSKLITATETIRKMRTNMDPLTPTTSTLTPAMSHIAETASAIAASLHQRNGLPQSAESARNDPEEAEKEAQRQTVRWVLDAPRRLREEVRCGQKEVAERDWDEVKGLLDKWKDVGGVEDVRIACEKVFKEGSVEVGG